MTTRLVKLKLATQQALVTIETGVRTLAEFKALPQVSTMNLSWDQISLIDRATRNTINLDSALLPNIDCLLFVQPTKTKSGGVTRSELYAIIKQMQMNGIEIPFNMTQTRTSVLEDFIAENELRSVLNYHNSPCDYCEDEEFYQIVDAENGLVVLRKIEAICCDAIEDGLDNLADWITNDQLRMEEDAIAKELK